MPMCIGDLVAQHGLLLSHLEAWNVVSVDALIRPGHRALLHWSLQFPQ